MTTTPAIDEVVLLDEHDRPCGTAPRVGVHDTDTPLHLAFSLHLLDPDGRTLLTRRALDKATWPGVWTNSCCGHPRVGEQPDAAAARRVGEELGVRVGDGVAAPGLVLPDFRYRAVDASGVVENEVCPVHVSLVERDLPLDPDPREVAETAWVDWADLHEAVRRTPVVFSPWMVLQVGQLGADVAPLLEAARAAAGSSSPGAAR